MLMGNLRFSSEKIGDMHGIRGRTAQDRPIPLVGTCKGSLLLRPPTSYDQRRVTQSREPLPALLARAAIPRNEHGAGRSDSKHDNRRPPKIKPKPERLRSTTSARKELPGSENIPKPRKTLRPENSTRPNSRHQLNAHMDKDTDSLELHRDQLCKLEEEQQRMRILLADITKLIEKQLETSLDEQKQQWENLYEDAQRQRISLEKAAKSTGAALDSTVDTLNGINQSADNPIMGKVVQGMKLTNGGPGLTKRIRGIPRLKPSKEE